jgi:hypothetical protein
MMHGRGKSDEAIVAVKPQAASGVEANSAWHLGFRGSGATARSSG